MSYFSRLTDIVTCNLSEILAKEQNPKTAIGQIIGEMEEGLAGARRSVKTAANSEERLSRELAEHRTQIDYWAREARQHLKAGDENQARLDLVRKGEAEDVIAGLEQQLKAAEATREHLSTTLRPWKPAWLKHNARRTSCTRGRRPHRVPLPQARGPTEAEATSADEQRARKIEEELKALKRELGK